MKIFRGKRLTAKLSVILLLGLCAAVLPTYKYVSSEIVDVDRLDAELGGADILRGLSAVAHIAAAGGGNSASRNAQLTQARASIAEGVARISRTNAYIKQSASGKFANLSALFAPEAVDGFLASKNKSSVLLEMSDGVLVASGLYSDTATDRFLLMKICGTYFPKIYSGLFRLSREIGEDGDKSQLRVIHEELSDDVDDLASALATLSGNFENGAMVQSSAGKIYAAATALLESLFSAGEFNPEEISAKSAALEGLCAQVWIYCTGQLCDVLLQTHSQELSELWYFALEFSLFVLIFTGAACALIIGIRRAVLRTGALAGACLGSSTEDAKIGYYATKWAFGSEFSRLDALIIESAERRERLAARAKRISEESGRRDEELAAKVSENIGLLKAVDDALERLKQNGVGDGLLDGAEKTANRLTESVGKLDSILPAREKIESEFATLISAQSKAAMASEDSLSSASDSIAQIDRLAGEVAAIADRIGLLGLNISIEVGKAGAEGSGLAVLSEQIKTLSKRLGVVVWDLEQIGRDCRSGIDSARDEVAALAAPLSSNRRAADKILGFVDAAREAVSTLSYAAERMGEFAKVRGASGLPKRVEQARQAVADAEKSLATLSRAASRRGFSGGD